MECYLVLFKLTIFSPFLQTHLFPELGVVLFYSLLYFFLPMLLHPSMTPTGIPQIQYLGMGHSNLGTLIACRKSSQLLLMG